MNFKGPSNNSFPLSLLLIFTFFKKHQYKTFLIFFTFYITLIIFYYYFKKKFTTKQKISTFLYKFFLLYITSITFYSHSKKNSLIKEGRGGELLNGAEVVFFSFKNTVDPFFILEVIVAAVLGYHGDIFLHMHIFCLFFIYIIFLKLTI
jgi:hypothetical protein